MVILLYFFSVIVLSKFVKHFGRLFCFKCALEIKLTLALTFYITHNAVRQPADTGASTYTKGAMQQHFISLVCPVLSLLICKQITFQSFTIHAKTTIYTIL